MTTLGVLACLAALTLCGRAVLGRALGGLRPLEGLVLAPFAGWAAIAWTLYVVNLPPLEMLPFLRLPSALLVALAGAAVLRWGWGRWAITAAPGELREARIVAAATLVVGGLYLLGYDRDAFAFSCTHRSVSIASRVPVGALWEAVQTPRFFLFDDETDMHGATAVLAVFPSVLGFFGVRLAYAATHAGLAACAWVAARRWGAGRAGASAVFVGAALHPAMIGTVVDDVNHVALLLSLVLWAGIGAQRGRGGRDAGLALGLLAGLVAGAWHPFVLSLPAAALLLRFAAPASNRTATLRWAAAGLALGVLPFALRHTVAFGSPFTLETWRDNAAAVHAAGAMAFEYSGLLNWPLHERWVRTPGNPFPVALLLPLYLLATTGTAALAVATLGLGRLPKRVAGAALLWGLPGAALLAVQENWFEPEKLQIATVWLAPAALCLARGVDGIVARPQRLAPALLIAALLGLGARAAGSIEVPVDARLQARWPHVRDELPAEVDVLRDRLSRGWPWPTYGLLARDRRTLAERGMALAEDAAAPRFSQRRESPWEHTLSQAVPEVWQLFLQGRERDPHELRALEAGLPVSIDLASLAGDPAVFRAGSLGPSVEGSLRVPWSNQPLAIAAFRARAAPRDVHVVLFGPPPPMLQDLEVDLPGAESLDFPPALPSDVDAVPWSRRGDRLIVSVPPSAQVQIRELISVEPTRTRRWMVPAAGASAGPGTRLAVEGPDVLRFN